MNKELLIKIPLFKTLPDAELDRLAASLTVREYPPETVIFREGQLGDRFYIILEGEVEAIKALGTSDERVLGVRGAGQFIGELSLINRNRSRTASIRSINPVRLWEMALSEFDALLIRQPALVYEVVQVLGERLIASETATIADLHDKNRQLAGMLAELQAAQAQIIEKEKLEHELQVAYQIQISILPTTLPQVSGYDFGAMMVPARVVGGDFYDIFRLGPDKIGIMIGDVADKGMPSAIFMARTHALLYAELNRNSSPVAVLKRVNRYLGQISNSPLFVTVLLGILYTQSGVFHYGRAGHELPIMVNQEGHIEKFPFTQGQLLGMLEDPIIDEQRVIIPSGGTVLIYTDGVTDERNPQGTSFGLNGVIETMKDCAFQPASGICEFILQRISAYQQGMSQDDDITMLVLKRN
jgi:sigma-B regulation protein RsbU (phosphoserine phosphatase)